MKPLMHLETQAVYQALCPQQLAALERAAWRRIEPGQGGEQFCCLKLQQRYAEMVARQWEVPVHGAGYVVRLMLPRRALDDYDLGTVAYEDHLEYCVPVCELRRLQSQLVGTARLVAAFREQHSYSIPECGAPLTALMG